MALKEVNVDGESVMVDAAGAATLPLPRRGVVPPKEEEELLNDPEAG